MFRLGGLDVGLEFFESDGGRRGGAENAAGTDGFTCGVAECGNVAESRKAVRLESEALIGFKEPLGEPEIVLHGVHGSWRGFGRRGAEDFG